MQGTRECCTGAEQLQSTLMTYRKRLYTELLGRLALQMPGVPPVGAGCIRTTTEFYSSAPHPFL